MSGHGVSLRDGNESQSMSIFERIVPAGKIAGRLHALAEKAKAELEKKPCEVEVKER